MDEYRYKINPSDEKDSRYRYLDRIRYSDGTELIETQGRLLVEHSVQDKIHIVKAHEEGRLDLISYIYYGTPLFWWVIAAASNVDDPLSIRAEDKLVIPSLVVANSLKGEVR